MWNFVSLDELKQHHTLSKEQSLTTFTDSPRIKVVEHENSSFIDLENKIEEKYHACVKRVHVSTFSICQHAWEICNYIYNYVTNIRKQKKTIKVKGQIDQSSKVHTTI